MDWQPIETAITQQAILLWRVGWSRPRSATYSAGAWWANNEPLRGIEREAGKYFWLPLPAAPTPDDVRADVHTQLKNGSRTRTCGPVS